MRHFLATMILATLAGCGGGGDSGIPDSKPLAEFTLEDYATLCEEIAIDRTVDCDGTEVTLGDPADCEPPHTFPATCDRTAGDVRDCWAALEALTDEEVCMLETLPEECAVLEDPDCG